MLDARRPAANVRFGLGTHDVELIEQIAALRRAAGPRARLEVEMLYGIRADQQRKLAARGLRRPLT